MRIPKNHPRYESLKQRHLIEEGMKSGIVTPTGMAAHGRGEAFDYLLGEKTTPEAREQIEAAAAMLLLAERPVITVNGNTTALCRKDIVKLSSTLRAPIEINLFHRTAKRAKLIQKEFRNLGIEVLGMKPEASVPGITSKRRHTAKEGVAKADVVLVMLEDGDRTEFLRKAGKKVIAIDLNPLSRTARKADIVIVDNVARAIPLLTLAVGKLGKSGKHKLVKLIQGFDNKKYLEKTIKRIRQGFL